MSSCAKTYLHFYSFFIAEYCILLSPTPLTNVNRIVLMSEKSYSSGMCDIIIKGFSLQISKQTENI